MRVELIPLWRGGKAGYLYNVTLDGDLIVESSCDPECDLARVLLARGITGKVTMVDGNTGKPRTQIDIERAAKLTVSEESRDGLRVRKYRENPDKSAPAGEDDVLVGMMPETPSGAVAKNPSPLTAEAA